jgi:hypothetical protein
MKESESFYRSTVKRHPSHEGCSSSAEDHHRPIVLGWLTHLWYFYLFLLLLLVTQINVMYMVRFLELKEFEEERTATDSISWTSSLSSDFINRKNYTVVDQAILFQQHSHGAIQRLINDTEIISWKRTMDKFFEELNISTLNLDIQRLHGWSDDDKLKAWSDTSRYYIWEPNLCFAARNFVRAGSVKPHVLLTYLNENRGAFSRDVKGRTVEWNHLATHWSSWGCTDLDIFQYLDHPNTKLVVTTQHQSYQHEKVVSIPLGVYPFTKQAILDHIHKSLPTRDRLLMINDNGKNHRREILDTVVANFNHTVNNTYQSGNYRGYVEELQRSKFILVPSGLGWDCYRIWESLYLGTIPIIERYGRPVDGWRWSLEELPVLWVDRFEEVTPELLEQKYQEIAAKGTAFNYAKLTRSWWVDFIKSHVPEEERSHKTVGSDESRLDVALDFYQRGDTEIPRIFHFVYVSPGLPEDQPALPSHVQRRIREWQQLHPTWMVMLWKNKAIRQEFPHLTPYLTRIKTLSWIANLVRYHALQRYGGVYLDTDVEPLRSLEPLLRFQHFSVCEKPASEGLLQNHSQYLVESCELVNNAVIGVPRNHTVFQYVVSTAMKNTRDELQNHPTDRYKLKTSGPPVWTEGVKQSKVNILHPSLFYPCNWDNPNGCHKEAFQNATHVYGVHEWRMSWYK